MATLLPLLISSILSKLNLPILTNDQFNSIAFQLPILDYFIIFTSFVLLLQLPLKWYRKYIAISIQTPLISYLLINNLNYSSTPVTLLNQNDTYELLSSSNQTNKAYGVQDSLTRQFNGIFLSMLILYSLELWLCIEYPELTDYRNFHAVKQDKEGKVQYETTQDVLNYKPFSMNKMHWSFDRTFANFRGVNWSFQLESVPLEPTIKSDLNTNKWIWIIKVALIEFLLKFMIFDICLNCLHSTKYFKFKPTGWSPEASDLLLNNDSSFCETLLIGLCLIYVIYFSLNACYFIFGCIFVAMGLYKPMDFPDQFQWFYNHSENKYEFTLRRLWGVSWHQYTTKSCHKLSKLIANKLTSFITLSTGIKPQKLDRLKKIMALCLTFLICGFIHAVSTSMILWENGLRYNTNIPRWCPISISITDNLEVYPSRWFYSLAIFVIEPALLIIEDTFHRLLQLKPINKLIAGKMSMVVNIICVMWLVITQTVVIGLYLDELLKGGLNLTLYGMNSPSSWLFA